MQTENANRRIAKNTIYLYIRTVVVMFVSLYTSRLVLQILGETDLGIYNVVGGIVTLLAFLQTAQSKATSRYITYELGENASSKRLGHVFSACMTIHILIVLLFLVIAESLGLWVVHHWIVVPSERMQAALWVYQFAVLTFCIHMLRVPYDAAIIAHENMSVYAYMSIIEVGLQLLMVVALKYILADHLILYAGALTLIAVILFILYVVYVRVKYHQYRFSWVWDGQLSMKILSFSGWTMLGSTANTMTQQGVGLLFNNFVGLVANAALGFANQVNAAIGRFVGSFTTAFNPQIIKLYAQRNYESLHLLMFRASKFSFALAFVMALPLILNMDFVLHLWLGQVPQYTVEFCQLIVLCTVIDATTGVYNTAVTATGQIRNYQIGISISFLLDLLCAYALLSLQMHPAIVFGNRILTRGLLNMGIGLYYCHKQLSFPIGRYASRVLLPIGCTVLLAVLCALPICHYCEAWSRLLLGIVESVVVVGICTFLLLMTISERKRIFLVLKSRFYHSKS